ATQGHVNGPQSGRTIRLFDGNAYQGERQKSWNDRNPKYADEIICRNPHEADRQQRAEECSDRVKRLAKPETCTANMARRDICNERVSWGAAYALAHAIDKSGSDQPPDGRCQRKHRLGERCQSITERRQELPPAQPIAQSAGKDLSHGGGRLG